MGILDNLFGNKKGPARGRGRSDDDADARADYTRTIRREEAAPSATPPPDEWEAAPPRAANPAPAPESREAPPVEPLPPPRRAVPPPAPAPAPPRVQPPPAPVVEEDEPPPTEYARVARPTSQRVAAVLLGVDGPLEGHVVRIYAGENIIGREAEPDAKESIPSSASSISRKHAKLIADGGYFVLEPVQVKNATLAGGEPVETHAVLQHGDRLTLGTTKPCTFVLLAVPA